MGCDILVDGYNVIKNNPMFQALQTKNLAAARDVLIKQLKNRYRHSIYRVTVVFDGNGAKEQRAYDDHICVIFSRHGETADRVIARLAVEARAKGQEILLYSNDGEVKQSVVEQGGRAHTTNQLTAHLNAAPKDVEIRAQHRQAMRRMYGIDPWYKAEDEYDPEPLGRKKKKKRSSRYRR